MTPEIIGSIASFIVAVIAGAIGYGRLQNKLDVVSDDNKNQWKIITDLRNWTAAHEKESASARREIDDKIGVVRELVLKNDSRWEEVLRRLDGIDRKIDKLETRDEKRT